MPEDESDPDLLADSAGTKHRVPLGLEEEAGGDHSFYARPQTFLEQVWVFEEDWEHKPKPFQNAKRNRHGGRIPHLESKRAGEAGHRDHHREQVIL